ncbi:MAG: type III pantothenate kinase [Bacteroidales bacterium]|nr:type III pantothenate kinase [Bacteroidales bacterium]
MNLTLDIGNTAVKWAVFEGYSLVQAGNSPSVEQLAEFPVDRAMVCASGDMEKVKPLLDSLDFQFSIFNSNTPLPIKLDYKTPATLGPDRLAAACGAWALHKGEPCLIVDAGTCVTVDYLDAAGTYHGGAIMPGVAMKLKALHAYTAKLPLVTVEAGAKVPVPGRSTDECIVAGTLGETQMAVAGFVTLYKGVAHNLKVLVTGGDAELVVPHGTEGREHVPHLTLIGLNAILQQMKK